MTAINSPACPKDPKTLLIASAPMAKSTSLRNRSSSSSAGVVLLGRSFLHPRLTLDRHRTEFGHQRAFRCFVNADLAVEAAGREPVGGRMKRNSEHGAFVALQLSDTLSIFGVE